VDQVVLHTWFSKPRAEAVEDEGRREQRLKSWRSLRPVQSRVVRFPARWGVNSNDDRGEHDEVITVGDFDAKIFARPHHRWTVAQDFTEVSDGFLPSISQRGELDAFVVLFVLAANLVEKVASHDRGF
jgi:hypothetical protein